MKLPKCSKSLHFCRPDESQWPSMYSEYKANTIRGNFGFLPGFAVSEAAAYGFSIKFEGEIAFSEIWPLMCFLKQSNDHEYPYKRGSTGNRAAQVDQAAAGDSRFRSRPGRARQQEFHQICHCPQRRSRWDAGGDPPCGVRRRSDTAGDPQFARSGACTSPQGFTEPAGANPPHYACAGYYLSPGIKFSRPLLLTREGTRRKKALSVV